MYECIMCVQNLGMAFRAWLLLPMAPGFQQGWSNKKLFNPTFQAFSNRNTLIHIDFQQTKKKRGWFSGKSPTATLHPPSCIKHHVMQKPSTIQPVNNPRRKRPDACHRARIWAQQWDSPFPGWRLLCCPVISLEIMDPLNFNGGNTQKVTHKKHFIWWSFLW